MLAEACVTALEPDLVILDEFQRFKDLLDGEDATAKLAKRLFTYSDEDLRRSPPSPFGDTLQDVYAAPRESRG